MSKLSVRVGTSVACCLIVLGVVGCAKSSSTTNSTTISTAPKADVVVAQADYSKPQTLTLGQMMDVEVSAPTGTNYSWSVREGYDALVVSQVDAPVVTPTKEGMPGAPAVTTFRFRAIGAGTTDIWIDLRDNATGSAAQAVRVPVTVTG